MLHSFVGRFLGFAPAGGQTPADRLFTAARELGDFGAGAFGRALANAGFEHARDVRPHEDDGVGVIDYAVPAGGVLLLVRFQNVAGEISGHMADRRWRHSVAKGRSVGSIANPILRNRSQIEAIRRRLNADVRHLVVFSDHAHFPAGPPTRHVHKISEAVSLAEALRREPDMSGDAWSTFLASCRSYRLVKGGPR